MRRWVTALRVAIVLVVALVVSFRSVPEARAQDAPTPVELDGSGSFDASALMSAWGSPLFESDSPINLSYIANGDHDGRTQLSLGQVDFTLSGMPMTDEDNQRLAARNVSVISAPIAISAMDFLFAQPATQGIQIFAPDPSDPDGGGATVAFNGDVRMPNSVLAQTMAALPGYRLFKDPDFVAQLNVPAGGHVVAPNLPQGAVARSDAGAANFYLETFIDQFATASYNQHLTDQLLPNDVISESWPLLDMTSRSGPSSVSDLIAGWTCPCGNGAASPGAIGAVDPTTAANALTAQDAKRTDPANHPGVPSILNEIAVQNGAGEWIKPTPQSITTAAAAGNGQALYGLTQNVPGAYPFIWTTNLFVRSTGLSIDKTNAIATFLRYAVGPGQDLAAGVDEGQLPAGLRAQAMTQADQIVKGNCKAAGGTTKVDPTGGPSWPNGVAAPAGGALLCVAPPGTATTTTQETSADSGSSGGSQPSGAGFGPTSFNSSSGTSGSGGTSGLSGGGASVQDLTGDLGATSGVDSSSVGSSSSGGGSASSAQQVVAAPASAQLPLKAPDDGEFELDRFVTILMGGAAFLLVRSFLRPRLASAPA